MPSQKKMIDLFKEPFKEVKKWKNVAAIAYIMIVNMTYACITRKMRLRCMSMMSVKLRTVLDASKVPLRDKNEICPMFE